MEFRTLQVGTDFANEFAQELRLRCRFHLQLTCDASILVALSEPLFKALNRGVALELVLVETVGSRDLTLTNALLRMGSAGADIFRNQSPATKEIPYAVLDKSFLIAASMPPDCKAQQPASLVLAYREDQRLLMRQGQRFEVRRESIDLEFVAKPDQTPAGTPVMLHWNSSGADSVRVEPGIGVVSASGSLQVTPGQDTVYTLIAENAGGQVARKQFVKVLSSPDARIHISVYEPDLGAWVDLQSPEGFEGYYALETGQRVRIRWDCPPSGQMSSDQLGQLPLSGSHELNIHQDTKMDFHYRQVFARQSWLLRFMLVPGTRIEKDSSDIEDPGEDEEIVSDQKDWRGFWRFFTGRKKPHHR